MKTVWSRIIICTVFGVAYYAADKVLADVERTIDATVVNNLLVAKKHIDSSGLSWNMIASWKTLWQAMASGDISFAENVSGTDNWLLKDY